MSSIGYCPAAEGDPDGQGTTHAGQRDDAGTGLYMSLRKRGAPKSRDEAFLGNRSIRVLPLALSMLASSITAAGIIAFVAHYYRHGFHTLWAIPVFVPVGLIVTYLYLPVLYELKVTSIFEVVWLHNTK
ncbi:sodium/iodide cotransporter-like [Dermacentor andersoni]|uniref:sodium/iodide cotransporter-like n=1 Tax=Dermacentor andersoni TaxID=34620 RepID=UPI003B3AD95D